MSSDSFYPPDRFTKVNDPAHRQRTSGEFEVQNSLVRRKENLWTTNQGGVLGQHGRT